MIAMSMRRLPSPPDGMLENTVPVWRDFSKSLSRKFISSSLTVNGMADASILFIVLSLIILVIIGILLIIAWKKKKEQHLSPLSLMGMVFIILGIVFGSDRLIGYSFLGAGVIVSVFDVVKNRKKK